MELIKRNIHMERQKCKASTQITLEDDINISDARPDASLLIMDRGNVVIDEMKVTQDHVTVKGKLEVSMLYLVDGRRGDVASMDATLPFEETLYVEGIESGDAAQVTWEVEDLKTGLINSRKCSVQSLLRLTVCCEEMKDEEIAVELISSEPVEFRKRTMEIAAAVIKKKDVFRIKEEVEIPGSFPNIFSMIYRDIKPADVEFKVLSDKITVQGEIRAFFLYRGEGEEEEICHYETAIPFAGSIDCMGANEGMIPEIRCQAEASEVAVRPDFDGEERVIGFELSLNLDICVYEEANVELLSDVYGVVNEVSVVEREADFRKLHLRSNGKLKLAEHIPAKEGAQLVRILHTGGEVHIFSQELSEAGTLINGCVEVKILYEDAGEEEKYGMLKQSLPFQYVLETEAVKGGFLYPVQVDVQQLTATILDGEGVDIKCVLYFRANVYREWKEKIIEQVNVKELDGEKMAALPGIAVYMVREGESLWDIGKRYYVPVSVLKQTNDLTSDEVKCGDRILIVKNR